jgi:hypothetical protein
MLATKSRSLRHPTVKLNTRIASRPYLVVKVPPEQAGMVQNALDRLAQEPAGVSAQTILLDALRIASEQAYFWTPEWQARERAADQAIAEGRVRTFDTMDEMLDFLNAQ